MKLKHINYVRLNDRGVTLVELLLVGALTASALLFLAIGLDNFQRINLRSGEKLDSKYAIIYTVNLIANTGRFANSCTNVNFNTLDCSVDFGRGVEPVHVAYDGGTNTLTYARSGVTTWTTNFVGAFYVCSGEDLRSGTCPDGGTPWVGTTYAANPGDTLNYFRVKLTAQLSYKHQGVAQAGGSSYTAESAFFSRNASSTSAHRYQWSPLGGM